MLTRRHTEPEDICTPIDLRAGSVLFRQGELVRQVVVLVDAEARATVDSRVVATLYAGAVLGVHEVGTPRGARATVTTTTPGLALVYTPSEWGERSSTRPQSSAVAASIV